MEYLNYISISETGQAYCTFVDSSQYDATNRFVTNKKEKVTAGCLVIRVSKQFEGAVGVPKYLETRGIIVYGRDPYTLT